MKYLVILFKSESFLPSFILCLIAEVNDGHTSLTQCLLLERGQLVTDSTQGLICSCVLLVLVIWDGDSLHGNLTFPLLEGA